ncbi:hypothetical protein BIW11_07893 [Tropilaelaps mercedesae]|uniref:Uncharacterized protein n=1 Tax=Tropilaelaps mercedesae TaxID=418985 RepID=A0A1V9XSB5_9ACAR|nr:hypothetical protein BIW11_07893 [Tropilaelaps mercedesae]
MARLRKQSRLKQRLMENLRSPPGHNRSRFLKDQRASRKASRRRSASTMVHEFTFSVCPELTTLGSEDTVLSSRRITRNRELDTSSFLADKGVQKKSIGVCRTGTTAHRYDGHQNALEDDECPRVVRERTHSDGIGSSVEELVRGECVDNAPLNDSGCKDARETKQDGGVLENHANIDHTRSGSHSLIDAREGNAHTHRGSIQTTRRDSSQMKCGDDQLLDATLCRQAYAHDISNNFVIPINATGGKAPVSTDHKKNSGTHTPISNSEQVADDVVSATETRRGSIDSADDLSFESREIRENIRRRIEDYSSDEDPIRITNNDNTVTDRNRLFDSLLQIDTPANTQSTGDETFAEGAAVTNSDPYAFSDCSGQLPSDRIVPISRIGTYNGLNDGRGLPSGGEWRTGLNKSGEPLSAPSTLPIQAESHHKDQSEVVQIGCGGVLFSQENGAFEQVAEGDVARSFQAAADSLALSKCVPESENLTRGCHKISHSSKNPCQARTSTPENEDNIFQVILEDPSTPDYLDLCQVDRAHQLPRKAALDRGDGAPINGETNTDKSNVIQSVTASEEPGWRAKALPLVGEQGDQNQEIHPQTGTPRKSLRTSKQYVSVADYATVEYTTSNEHHLRNSRLESARAVAGDGGRGSLYNSQSKTMAAHQEMGRRGEILHAMPDMEIKDSPQGSDSGSRCEIAAPIGPSFIGSLKQDILINQRRENVVSDSTEVEDAGEDIGATSVGEVQDPQNTLEQPVRTDLTKVITNRVEKSTAMRLDRESLEHMEHAVADNEIPLSCSQSDEPSFAYQMGNCSLIAARYSRVAYMESNNIEVACVDPLVEHVNTLLDLIPQGGIPMPLSIYQSFKALTFNSQEMMARTDTQHSISEITSGGASRSSADIHRHVDKTAADFTLTKHRHVTRRRKTHRACATALDSLRVLSYKNRTVYSGHCSGHRSLFRDSMPAIQPKLNPLLSTTAAEDDSHSSGFVLDSSRLPKFNDSYADVICDSRRTKILGQQLLEKCVKDLIHSRPDQTSYIRQAFEERLLPDYEDDIKKLMTLIVTKAALRERVDTAVAIYQRQQNRLAVARTLINATVEKIMPEGEIDVVEVFGFNPYDRQTPPPEAARLSLAKKTWETENIIDSPERNASFQISVAPDVLS